MSYKYSNVREYQGALVFENRKNLNNVKINADGIKYTQDNEQPNASYFALELNGDNSSVTFYKSALKYHSNLSICGDEITFHVSGVKEQKVGINAISGIFFSDIKNNKYNRMTANGLKFVDGSGASSKSCNLTFEDGVLKINGKEIATVENS